MKMLLFGNIIIFGHMGQREPTLVRFALRFLHIQNVFCFLRIKFLQFIADAVKRRPQEN